MYRLLFVLILILIFAFSSGNEKSPNIALYVNYVKVKGFPFRVYPTIENEDGVFVADGLSYDSIIDGDLSNYKFCFSNLESDTFVLKLNTIYGEILDTTILLSETMQIDYPNLNVRKLKKAADLKAFMEKVRMSDTIHAFVLFAGYSATGPFCSIYKKDSLVYVDQFYYESFTDTLHPNLSVITSTIELDYFKNELAYFVDYKMAFDSLMNYAHEDSIRNDCFSSYNVYLNVNIGDEYLRLGTEMFLCDDENLFRFHEMADYITPKQ